MKEHLRYSYAVSWSEDDDAFVSRVSEFPSLAAHGDSAAEALAELQGVVEEVIEDLQGTGEAIPRPRSELRYSGRFNVRMPSELHRRLSEVAEEEGVSLNQLVVTRLARG